VEKSKSRLFHLAWKSRKKRGIPTFHTASTAAGYSFLGGLTGSDPNRRNWLPLSPALTVKATSPASGPEMYTSYCAVCHGIDGKGNGPAAEALKVPPPDLTALAKKNGGKYPSDHVTTVIRGDLRLAAHGTKEMPVWGDLFWGMSQGHSSEVQLRVTNLNKYIESLQAK